MSNILMYVINSIQEIPANPLPNTAYYVIGQQVVIFDSANHKNVFTPPNAQAPGSDGLNTRLTKCEETLAQITTYLGTIKPFNLGGN